MLKKIDRDEILLHAKTDRQPVTTKGQFLAALNEKLSKGSCDIRAAESFQIDIPFLKT